MRCFVAVAASGSLAERVAHIQKQMLGHVQLIPAKNLHITLKFIGDVSDAEQQTVSQRLESVALRFAPFSAPVAGMGTFPPAGQARVVWIGVPAILNLQKAVDDVLKDFGDNKGIIPHLTIARLRDKNPGIRRFVEQHAGTEFGSLHIDRLALMRSVLTPHGAVYETVREFQLAPRNSDKNDN